MDDSRSQEPKKDENAEGIDLSELKSFSFGTQWSPSTVSKDEGRARTSGRDPGRGDRPDRRPGPPGGGQGGAVHRDRRPARPPRQAPAGAPAESAPERRFDRAERPDRGEREDRGRFRGREQAERQMPPKPYESEVFAVGFYPDDNCFSAIIKAMRANHLTYELFEVARLFMEKPDRYIASVTRKAAQGEKPEKVYTCAQDNMPFATEEEALRHAFANHLGEFFATEEAEIDPPSGKFSYVNRCPFTKALLSPPNYHRYEEILRNHHRTRLPNMDFDKLRSSIETVGDEETVKQWLESTRKITRYKLKTAEGEEPKSFDSADEALNHLRVHAKAKVARAVNYARVSGAVLEKFPESEARRAAEGERQRQLRFPLDTANAIRGRLRREKFSIYKKGAKGVTFICATKRNFRTPGQVMSPALDRIIRFIEANPTIKGKEVALAFELWLKTEAPDEVLDDKKLARDLHWLISDGYVSHFSDDSLFAQPVLESGAKGREDDDDHHHPRSDGHGHGRSPRQAKEAPAGDRAPQSTASDDAASAEGATASAEEPAPAEQSVAQAPLSDTPPAADSQSESEVATSEGKPQETPEDGEEVAARAESNKPD